MTNTISPHKVISLSPPAISERSRLYKLEPIGIGTAYVESQTGYITRLAEAHAVSAAVLFGYELVPLLDKNFFHKITRRSKYKSRILASAFKHQARAINGLGVTAYKWAEIMKVLTGRGDLHYLSMLLWKDILPSAQLLRPVRAWCPKCYEQWRDNSGVVYEPLLWTLKTISMCPYHLQRLSVRCDKCLHVLHIMGPRSRPGYCSFCGAWLGRRINAVTDMAALPGEDRYYLWMSNSVGELIANTPNLMFSEVKKGITRSFLAYLNVYAGKLSALAEELHVHKTTIWQWYRGRSLPRLDLLSRVCHFFKISLLDFVTGNIHVLDSRARAPGSSAVALQETTFSRRRVSLNLKKAQLIIYEALEEIPAPSLKEVAGRLGHDANTVRYRFPQLCKEIVDKHGNYKRARYLEKGEEIRCQLSLALNVVPPPHIKELAQHLNCSVATLKVRCPALYKALSERHIAFKRERMRKLRATLLKILREEHPPPSVSKIVRQLGCGSSSLYKYFPDLCHRISARYSLHKKKSIDRIPKLDMCLTYDDSQK